jgi:hypothetical protein
MTKPTSTLLEVAILATESTPPGLVARHIRPWGRRMVLVAAAARIRASGAGERPFFHELFGLSAPDDVDGRPADALMPAREPFESDAQCKKSFALLPHCFHRRRAWKQNTCWTQEINYFQKVGGAPGTIRTSDPQIRSLVVKPHKRSVMQATLPFLIRRQAFVRQLRFLPSTERAFVASPWRRIRGLSDERVRAEGKGCAFGTARCIT